MTQTPANSSRRPRSAAGARATVGPATVRVGLLGLGNVGQSVARLCAASRGLLRRRGLDLMVTGALVRNAATAREFAPRDILLTDRVDEFFQEDYDLVIEVMGGVHPAFDYLERALRRGIPIVTANKSLMAARGVELFQIAAESNTSLRCEASAIAGVPFLSALRDRPLIARVHQLSGILNGTSNYIVSSMDTNGVSFADALRSAQEKGYAEPDPTFDVEGIDAAEKLVVILQHLGITGIRARSLDIVGITQLKTSDFRQARALGGAIKPVAYARIADDSLQAFVGPAFVSSTHLLTGVAFERNGIRLRGPEIGDLVFTGPGAGPEVTAATILDDATQIVTEGSEVLPPAVTLGSNDRRIMPPTSPWLIRAILPPDVPEDQALKQVSQALATHGVSVRKFACELDHEEGRAVYALTNVRPIDILQAAADHLREALRADVFTFRVLEE